MYENGKGVTHNAKVAVGWYQKSTEQGNAAAQENLGRMLLI
jgi:TPR repeat protein